MRFGAWLGLAVTMAVVGCGGDEGEDHEEANLLRASEACHEPAEAGVEGADACHDIAHEGDEAACEAELDACKATCAAGDDTGR